VYARNHFGGQHLYMEELTKNIEFARAIERPKATAPAQAQPPATNRRNPRAALPSTGRDGAGFRRSCDSASSWICRTRSRVTPSLAGEFLQRLQLPAVQPERHSITVRCLSESLRQPLANQGLDLARLQLRLRPGARLVGTESPIESS